MARAGLWSALAFVLNLAWELAHVRLYTIWAEADGMDVARMMLWRADWRWLSPWLILPPAMVGAYRKLGPMLFGHRTEA